MMNLHTNIAVYMYMTVHMLVYLTVCEYTQVYMKAYMYKYIDTVIHVCAMFLAIMHTATFPKFVLLVHVNSMEQQACFK